MERRVRRRGVEEEGERKRTEMETSVERKKNVERECFFMGEEKSAVLRGWIFISKWGLGVEMGK